MSIQKNDYKISTITATGSVNSLLDLNTLYETFQEDDNIIYIEYGNSKSTTFSKGVNPKVANRKRKKTKETKRFDNQVTLIIRDIGNENIKMMYNRTDVNVKLFKNGNIQMTGLKTIEQGKEIVKFIVNKIKQFENIAINPDSLCVGTYKVQLINSDFRINKSILRSKLNYIINTEYKLESVFEPCIYPGVKIKYMWNSMSNNGVCSCKGECECKKITIAVFQSGCIIITGSQNIQQIDDTYEFINKVLEDKQLEICKDKLISN